MNNSTDIGVDLGTTKVMICKHGEGIVLNQPSVVAYDSRTGDIVAYGDDAAVMIGKTNKKLVVEFPLNDGVVSNYTLTKEMVKHFIEQVYPSKFIKPKVCICVPSTVTGIEENAVTDAAVAAGAREVLIIDEPIAAALGAGVDIFTPSGHMIVDIGGGTTDIAVISLGGIVCSKSIKIAGNAFDKEITRLIKLKYGFLAGGPSIKQLKHKVADCMPTEATAEYMDIKGINLSLGLPGTLRISSFEIYDMILPLLTEILNAIKQVLEITPPELSGDIHTNGIILTGAGSKLKNLDKFLKENLGVDVSVAENCESCVVRGIEIAFDNEDKFERGFRDVTPYKKNGRV